MDPRDFKVGWQQSAMSYVFIAQSVVLEFR